MDYETWKEANEHERQWWGDCTNTSDEEGKQVDYAKYMGLDVYKVPGVLGLNLDLQGKSILDIGGGPVSMLLKCRNKGRAVVVDPCNFPEWVKRRYEDAGIQFINCLAEDLEFRSDIRPVEKFDEVWIYNVLEHVFDPEKVLEIAKEYGKVIRIFEWVNKTYNSEGHPHSTLLTKDWLDRHLGVWGSTVQISWVGRATPLAYYAVVNQEEPEPKFRFHMLGLAHVPTRKDISTCAYTQKVYKLAQMLKSLGYEVFFYGIEFSEVPGVDEYIECLSDKQRRECYGDYDWWAEFFKHDGQDSAYTAFNKKAAEEINKRWQPRDFLLCPMGHYNKYVADNTMCMAVESGIGYSGVFLKYKVFESYAWMSYVYGLMRQGDGSWYDAVIPNYFDPEDFPFCEDKQDYFLYMGRLIKRKGVEVASQVSRYLGKKLIIAGQGGLRNEAEGIDLTGQKHIEHVGAVGPEKRKELFGHAQLTFLATYYIEPFGGTAVESQFCGTPVLTTDWGVFSETIQHGVTGFRCRTFDDFIFGAKQIMDGKIDYKKCHEWAVNNYSMDRIKFMYKEYFTKLYDINEQGWYKIHPNRKDLNWLRRYY